MTFQKNQEFRLSGNGVIKVDDEIIEKEFWETKTVSVIAILIGLLGGFGFLFEIFTLFRKK